MMLNTVKIVLLISASLFAGMSHAAKPMATPYKPNFDRDGIITGSVQNQQLLINATRYTLDPNVRVHTPQTEFASPQALATDAEVGFNLVVDKVSSQYKIIEIWVLPKGSVVLN